MTRINADKIPALKNWKQITNHHPLPHFCAAKNISENPFLKKTTLKLESHQA
jgi:hypothetical protein